ncbi:hypothetical protein GNZ10_13705 [Ralstonia sp. 3N]|uniref:hypothetical protein n=1 Tax=Ralstonia sp. 3N TaxID=2675750 RepID=UPI0015C554F5|nr:hypothetical protein [Ralstonia sp. 3N]NPT50752.1 hypothetical protein [Ralstonia sp. 3N]
MTQLQEQAIARSADHENLVGELVEALKEARTHLLSGEIQWATDIIGIAIEKAEARQ